MNDDSSVCVVVMELKTKFETMKHSNNAVENIGKRGLSLYCVRVYVEPGVYTMRKETMYIDHINTIDKKEDATVVVLLIGAILNCIKRILTNITNMILHSDIARLYQNAIVKIFIHMISI